ncbi:SpoIIE family protein phosphatase [Blastococcus brunescens]|uniref:SpoIIE family protein phosphatase n=1 Tax=Blastococcus brunescens TaxID=1564165 RepID=A0ABZ1B717_9ACTN|nr:SpoIIE family protein phosphatase [Blastococcus sp. BMG 8361]WRL66581.1 SpoIIE family protein phosphatase [Blastococcus sp. BMG 8361]
MTVEYVSRRRLIAERLAAENERLYRQQRGIAGTLQHALLPVVPDIGGVEVAARYVAGVDELEVGGDWYDVIARAPGCCVFVVGDISGRGLPAATTMAALRFAVRAFVSEGHDIEVVMAKLRGLLDIETDHQFATVLLGELDASAGRLRLVSAGHFAPVLLTADGATLLECPTAPPVGLPDDMPPPAAVVTVGRGPPSWRSPTARWNAGGDDRHRAGEAAVSCVRSQVQSAGGDGRRPARRPHHRRQPGRHSAAGVAMELTHGPRARLDVRAGSDGELVLHLAGELDLASLPAVAGPLAEALARPPQPVVLDLGSWTSSTPPASPCSCGSRTTSGRSGPVRRASRCAASSKSWAWPHASAWRRPEMPSRSFSAWPDSIPAARAYVGHALDGVPAASCQTAVLLVSELVTNVVRHAGGHDFVVEIQAFPDEGRLWVGVTDTEAGLPVLLTPPVTAEGGRGMQLVSTLADRWGARRRRHAVEKTVWFELSYPPHHAPAG